MELKGVQIRDSAAEAFDMWAARLIVTAANEKWARAAARSAVGFATSVIGCRLEAGLDRFLPEDETPDGRPGLSLLLFTRDKDGLEDRLVDRIGQCVLTCPTTACWDGLPGAAERTQAGKRVSYFGDGHQESGERFGRTVWAVPVYEGAFLVEESFGMQPAVGGGNFLILAEYPEAAVSTAEAAVTAIREIPDVILPFPGGVCRAGSKVGSESYSFMGASTNDRFCPPLRDDPKSALPEEVDSVAEIVVDGLTEDAVRSALRAGIPAACQAGVVAIDAASFGGRLGDRIIRLHDVLTAGL